MSDKQTGNPPAPKDDFSLKIKSIKEGQERAEKREAREAERELAHLKESSNEVIKKFDNYVRIIKNKSSTEKENRDAEISFNVYVSGFKAGIAASYTEFGGAKIQDVNQIVITTVDQLKQRARSLEQEESKALQSQGKGWNIITGAAGRAAERLDALKFAADSAATGIEKHGSMLLKTYQNGASEGNLGTLIPTTKSRPAAQSTPVNEPTGHKK